MPYLAVAPLCFFFNDTATTEIYTLSLHDALPILTFQQHRNCPARVAIDGSAERLRSEEHTSELQSHSDLVCRLLLEKNNIKNDSVLRHSLRNVQLLQQLGDESGCRTLHPATYIHT